MGSIRSNISSIRIRYIHNVTEMGSLILYNFPIGKKEVLICKKQIKTSFCYKSLYQLQNS